jgi:hypothetical protein
MKSVKALETYCGKIIPSDAGEQGYHASKCLSCRIVRSLHSFDGRATARQVADKIDKPVGLVRYRLKHIPKVEEEKGAAHHGGHEYVLPELYVHDRRP